MSALRFSVVVPCLTDASTLNRCLESVSGGNFPSEKYEIVVVDDGSEPALGAVIQDFKSNPDKPTINLAYFRNPENIGRSRTRNRGIAESSGEIVLFMDVDQVVDPGLLEALDAAFGAAPLKSVRANTRVWPPLLGSSAYLRYYDSRFLGNRPPDELTALNLKDLPAKYFASGCIAVTRAALELVGGFDEEFRYYGCEDEELGSRLEEAGVPLSLCLEAEVFNVADDLNIKRVCKRFIEYAQRSVPILLRKHPSYANQTLLWLLEVPAGELSAKHRFARSVLISLFRPWLAWRLVSFLDKRDARPGFNPPAALYKLAIAGFYLQGYRLRDRGVSA